MPKIKAADLDSLERFVLNKETGKFHPIGPIDPTAQKGSPLIPPLETPLEGLEKYELDSTGGYTNKHKPGQGRTATKMRAPSKG